MNMSKEDIKNILILITKEKRIKNGNCMLFVNRNIYEAIEEANMVVHWEEKCPGAIWMHCNICGLPVIIDPHEPFYSVVSQSEAVHRILSMWEKEE